MIQIIYASAATHDFQPEELATMLRGARERNRAAGITGMLVYHDGSFLQVIEGEEEVVDKLYDRIASDKRHASVRMLLRTEIEERTFSDWTMGFVNMGTMAIEPPPGFIDFFRRGNDFRDFDGDRAKTVLMQFRRGQWHFHVNEEAASPALVEA